MDAMRMLATVLQVLWLHAASVHSQVYPSTRPTCDHLEITPCKYHHSVDSKGNYDFRYYYEECFFHKCAYINPLKAPPPPPFRHWHSPPPALKVADEHSRGMNRTQARTGQKAFSGTYRPTKEEEMAQHHALMLKYADPDLVGEDSEGRFVRSTVGRFTNFWFCSGGGDNDPTRYDYRLNSGVRYHARVVTNAPRPPGQTEDLRAHCEWMKFKSLLQVSACDSYGCLYQCMASWRVFLCAILFPRCEVNTGHGFGPGMSHPKLNNSGGVIYGPPNITDDIGASYTIVKPCRAVCFDAKRKCQSNSKIQCHLKESRDWADVPHCEYLDSPDGSTLYV